MDLKTCREARKKVTDLSNRLNVLSKLQQETIKQQIEICNCCSHDYILISNRYACKDDNFYKSGFCLVCSKPIILTSNNYLLEGNIAEQLISEDKIIDISNPDILEMPNEGDCVLDRCLIEESQSVFDSLINDEDYEYPIDCIRNEITEAVARIKKINKIKK